MKRIRIGIIGTGKMANGHAKSFKALRGVSLAACHDVDAERAQDFANRHGVARAVTDVKELFAVADAVSIVTPDKFHAELTIQALRAGKHVLCEKPLAVTLAEARRVAREAKKASTRGLSIWSTSLTAAPPQWRKRRRSWTAADWETCGISMATTSRPGSALRCGAIGPRACGSGVSRLGRGPAVCSATSAAIFWTWPRQWLARSGAFAAS